MFMKYGKRSEKFFAKHVLANSAAHLLLGMGIGIIFARPYAGLHPVRWGLVFIVAAVVWHIWAGTRK